MTPGVQRFFEQVSDAYRQSPWELVGIIVLILGLIGGLVAYAVVLSRRQARQQKGLRDRLFEEKARELKLNAEQRELIGRMGKYLKESGSLYKLLSDEIAFNAAAVRIREIEQVGAQTIAALRLALGYETTRQDRAPHSSAAIPEGATVLLVRNKYRQPIKAKALARQGQSFQVRILEEGAKVPTEATISVYFQNSAGVFTFESTVLSQENGVLQLSHSEQIKQYQKRRYYRRKIDLPVHIYPFDEDKPILSKFKDIGGGGASLVNPQRRFKAGDDLELRFKPAGDLEVRLTASIVRLSDGGKVIHVNYEHIREALRDRIYHAIFKPPKDEEEAAKQRTGARPGSTSGAKPS